MCKRVRNVLNMLIRRNINTLINFLIEVKLGCIFNHFLHAEYNDLDELGPDVGHVLLYVSVHFFDAGDHILAAIRSNMPLTILENILANTWQNEISYHLITVLNASQMLDRDSCNLLCFNRARTNDLSLQIRIIIADNV